MRGKVTAALVAAWIVTGLYVTGGRMLARMAAQGEELRGKRARPESVELGAVILGWTNGTVGDGTALREAVLSDLDRSSLSVLEVYVDGPENSGFWHKYLNPFPVAPRLDLMVTLQFKDRSLDEAEVLRRAQAMIDKATTLKLLLSRSAVYVVNRSVYTEYGEYDGPAVHDWDPSHKRDWSLGSRSPYITTITCFTKPKQFSGLAPMEWAREKWWKQQSPMSEIMQPRPRYVRNVVLQSSPKAPPFGGIVVEAWPSKRHMLNLFLFFDASNISDLLVRISAMLISTTGFASLSELQSIVLSEYLVLL